MQRFILNGVIVAKLREDNVAATGDPAVLDLNLECLKSPVNTDMWQLIIYDDALLT